MKKLVVSIIVLVLITMVSCSTNDVDCDCQKQIYELEQYTYIDNGLPRTGVRKNIISYENGFCGDEVQGVLEGNLYYNVICN